MEQERYQKNHLEDKLYVMGKQLEQREQVVQALSIRYDTEYARFED
jgi:hypothetical protein